MGNCSVFLKLNIMERLDKYDKFERPMREYLEKYGWHFSKKMYEFAVSNMVDRNGEKMVIRPKEEIDDKFRRYGISLTYKGYDAPFVYCMAVSDFFGSSLMNEEQVLKYVRDYLGDIDGYDGIAFTRFYADTIGSGTPIIWEDVL